MALKKGVPVFCKQRRQFLLKRVKLGEGLLHPSFTPTQVVFNGNDDFLYALNGIGGCQSFIASHGCKNFIFQLLDLIVVDLRGRCIWD